MKNIFVLLVLTLLFSCEDDQNHLLLPTCCVEEVNGIDDVVGGWKLSELKTSSGGISAFKSVDSERYIDFYKDGVFCSIGLICRLTSELDGESTGTYSSDVTLIHAPDCDGQNHWLPYQIEGDELIITYSCSEICAAKYIRQ